MSPLHAVSRSLPRRCAAAARRSLPSVQSRVSPPFNYSRSLRSATSNPSPPPARDSSNPALSFPCLDAQDAKSALLSARSLRSGPEPSYTTGQHEQFHCKDPLLLDWGGLLPEFELAYETWGQLNANKDNVILLHTGLSASSHAHSTDANQKPGWWEKFIGAGKPLDTDKYFVVCTNVLGGCYGSTGPSTVDPSDGKKYATRFPILTIEDMVRAQFRLLDHLEVRKLYASVGSSMGGMQSLAATVLFPERVGKVVSISGCARSHPYSIAMRHTQRQVLMMDPNWARGFYYDSVPPHSGMKLAREIATVTYRSGPEWEKRFGRNRADPSKQPALCPDFLIETYLDHAGEKFCLEYDPNSLLYISKAMDLFDLGLAQQLATKKQRAEYQAKISSGASNVNTSCNLTLPDQPYQEQPPTSTSSTEPSPAEANSEPGTPPNDLVAGLAPLRNHQVLVVGVASDILFPAWQQREVAQALMQAGNKNVQHIELGEDLSLFGHDTFLLDLKNIGGAVQKFLS
ncbi:Alpha/Beta hydrolase protein [Aspergillus aurantiobrunneus]